MEGRGAVEGCWYGGGAGVEGERGGPPAMEGRGAPSLVDCLCQQALQAAVCACSLDPSRGHISELHLSAAVLCRWPGPCPLAPLSRVEVSLPRVAVHQAQQGCLTPPSPGAGDSPCWPEELPTSTPLPCQVLEVPAPLEGGPAVVLPHPLAACTPPLLVGQCHVCAGAAGIPQPPQVPVRSGQHRPGQPRAPSSPGPWDLGQGRVHI